MKRILTILVHAILCIYLMVGGSMPVRASQPTKQPLQKAAGIINIYLPLVVNERSGLIWNTFLGSPADDYAKDIALDGSGNVYVVGVTYATWGSPVNPYAGVADAFVAKLNGNGALLWNTFLGSASYDDAYGIAVDGNGNVYVTGYSADSWGMPLQPYAGGGDTYVAKLNPSGMFQWNTFLGGKSSYDAGSRIALDVSGDVYILGQSDGTWGAPVSPFAGADDVFAAKLNGSGALQWNTFLGSAKSDYAFDLAADGSGNAYVTGSSNKTWGTPVNPFTGNSDGFAAKLNNNGALVWNTFLGSVTGGEGIAVDGSGNVYVVGVTQATWGSPVNPYAGGADAFVAKLNGSGALLWNTFLGSAGYDDAASVAVDGSGNVYAAGSSDGSWGAPVNPFAGGYDGFAAKLNSSGILVKNTFLGSINHDAIIDIAVDGSRNIFATGSSNGTWGAPVNPFAGSNDAFVTKIRP